MNSKVCYFFPSIIGDDSHCRFFRDDLSHVFDVRMIDFPDLTSESCLLLNFNCLCASLAQRIAHEGFANFYLCGYSFGGCVAHEVGKILSERGINISGIIVIDAPTPSMIFDLHTKYSGNTIPKRSIVKTILTESIWHILRYRKFRMLYIAMINGLQVKNRSKFNRMAVKILREKARRKTWHPTETMSSGIVFLTSQFARANKEFWLINCKKMAFYEVDTRHLLIVRRGYSENVIKKIERYLNDRRC